MLKAATHEKSNNLSISCVRVTEAALWSRLPENTPVSKPESPGYKPDFAMKTCFPFRLKAVWPNVAAAISLIPSSSSNCRQHPKNWGSCSSGWAPNNIYPRSCAVLGPWLYASQPDIITPKGSVCGSIGRSSFFHYVSDKTRRDETEVDPPFRPEPHHITT